MRTKGQSGSNSAVFIIVLTALIVLYILFLPPQDRAELLGTSTSTGSPGTPGSGSTYEPSTRALLEERVGPITRIGVLDREHNIPSLRIGTSTSGTILKETASAHTKSSVFDFTTYELPFQLEPNLANDVRLSFNTGTRANGRLIITLNGQRILDDEVQQGSSRFVTLPTELLTTHNELLFAVSSPGWAFWNVNEYQLLNLQVTATLTDMSASASRHTFTISEEEIDQLERATLRFYPDCVQQNAGRLTVRLNARTLYNSQADCGVMNTITLDSSQLYTGENDLEFTTDKGNYLISNIAVKTTLKQHESIIYYFELPRNLFTQAASSTPVCGLIDGVCPPNCNENIDKDCCFQDRTNYWCDFETAILNDRCVPHVSAQTCDRCFSGYEDYRGRAPSACQEVCGDDYDGVCPAGCGLSQDKDCCFAQGEDYYWCDDLPTGMPTSARCKAGISMDQRKTCPSTYYNKNNHRLTYTREEQETEEQLRNPYEVMFSLEFTDQQLHRADILINGRPLGMNTYGMTYTRDISELVRSGTNTVQVLPETSMHISLLKVNLER